MVRAILDGRKTVTRRCVKPQPQTYARIIKRATDMFMWQVDMQDKDIKPPYQQGDILYVRETWCKTDCFGACDGYVYRAETPKNLKILEETTGFVPKWKPSIHMPKEAARIFLKVTDVRVERLQEITEDEAIKEGIYKSNCRNCNAPFGCDACGDEGYDEVDEFVELWDSTIKKSDLDTYGWDANQWVWVIEFERIEV